jgi:hypothetical protein
MPRSIGRFGAGVCTIWSQQAHAFLRRMCRITLKAGSIRSSCSDTSSPKGLSLPPHSEQAWSGGPKTLSSRGRCSGSGWRATLRAFDAGSVAFCSLTPSSAIRSSSRVSSCSILRSNGGANFAPACLRVCHKQCRRCCRSCFPRHRWRRRQCGAAQDDLPEPGRAGGHTHLDRGRFTDMRCDFHQFRRNTQS